MTSVRLFDPQAEARVFGVPIGVDFPDAVVEGLRSRLAGEPPEAIARVEILVNTSRMQRRLREILSLPGSCGLLPKIRLLTGFGSEPAFDLPPATPPLRRQLELAELVTGLLARAPDLGPREAMIDLTGSLVRLLDECEGEGVPLATLTELDVDDHSAHWQRALRFISIIAPFLEATGMPPGLEGRQRRAVLNQIQRWQEAPPDHPVLLVGSTGSRGTTSLLMEAIAQLPQGAVILPGFDFDQPSQVWSDMRDALTHEDHPQFRLGRFLDRLGLDPTRLQRWSATPPQVPARNKLISLALRPAPVTDQWRREGPALDQITEAMAQVSLVEAPSERSEALSIAIALRIAAAEGKRAALVSPDRMLTRQVTAALDRWRIEPDDSAGRPLILSAPGRFLRHIAEQFGRPLTAASLLILLKHPLTHSEHPLRGEHLRHTRDLELHLRAHPWTPLTAEGLRSWAGATDPARASWADWVVEVVFSMPEISTLPLTDMVLHHWGVAEKLAAGPGRAGAGGLWNKAAGAEALASLLTIREAADAGGDFAPRDYARLLAAQFAAAEVRDPARPDPRVMIWGTLEARIQGADLVILAGLNEGSWPGMPDPDPWMNRQMRHEAGLLVPERQIGLSAHDFQQAIGAREVILSRSTRDSDAETVPSRWLNRLVNLLAGIGPDGRAALEQMRKRGGELSDLARLMDRPARPTLPARRPSPKVRRKQIRPRISASRVETLVRDPFRIYAQDILRLSPLNPLDPAPDGALRGTVLHKVLEQALRKHRDGQEPVTASLLSETAAQVIAQLVPWPETQTQWLARFNSYVEAFADTERDRLAQGQPIALEMRGEITLANGFVLSCEADRIDRTPQGSAILYDYKTGALPSAKQITQFAKQLHLEAMIAEAGGFSELGPMAVSKLAFLRLNKDLGQRDVDLAQGEIAQAQEDLLGVLNGFLSGARGYTARRMPERMLYISEYDHLSRFGEWNLTDVPDAAEMP